MLKRVLSALRGTSRDRSAEAAARLPPGERVYAIGDVHGRLDLLTRMRDLVAADIDRTRPDTATVVLLGDYVDRGPHSCGVIDYLLSAPFPVPTIHLRGNHEAMLLDFIDRPEAGEQWRRFGGIETVHSYGIDVTDLRAGRNLLGTSRQLHDTMPTEHLAFLHELTLTHQAGAFFFCHAGVRPGVPLAQQRPEDLLWIREDFIGSDAAFGAVIVHGHTPGDTPQVRPNAIGIDTGAYITGKLTCAALSAEGVAFLST